MATVDTLHYYPHSPTSTDVPAFHFFPSHVSSPSSPVAFTDFIPSSQWAALQSQWTSPTFRHSTFGTPNQSPVVPPGAIIAANVVSNHGKLHKRAVQKTPRRRSKHDDAYSTSDIALTRTKTPPPSASASPNDGPRSPSTRSITRGILKQNLRKFSQHQDDEGPDTTIDLSRTAEENEERSGLGISTSRSLSDMGNAVPSYRAHSRSHSHNSQASTASGPYQPTMPYVIPMRDHKPSHPPPLNRPCNASVEELDFSGEVYEPVPDHGPHRIRGATLDSTTSARDHRPKLHLITDTDPLTAPSPIFNQNPSLTSLERVPTRPRRSTTQSARSATEPNVTPKSKSSADARTFSFLSRSKQPDGIDTLARAANIQAARQAFDDREEGKIRKYEEQEQRALSRQHRKSIKSEERKHRKSDAGLVNTPLATPILSTTRFSIPSTTAGQTPVERHDFASGGEYAGLGSSPHHRSPASGPECPLDQVELDHDELVVAAGKVPSSVAKRRPSIRMTYVQFLTWMRTKLLNAGRRRRRA